MVLAALAVAPAGTVQGAEAPAGGSLQQNQLMRQQQQDALQLRMLQQQRSLQAPPKNARARQDSERQAINQEQRQRELQYRQRIEAAPARAGDEPGTQRAAADRKLRQAQEEGETQLRRFDYELEHGTERQRVEKARGEVKSPQPSGPLR